MDIFNVLTMIGGLCLFLFGMNLMGQALERRAGGKLRSLLDKMTGSVFAGFLTGLGITAIIQSSSATTVMVVGFVNSGLMTLRQAINVIMGANVGTTVTAWLLSLGGIDSGNFWIKLLKPSSFTPVLALIGIIYYMFCKDNKKKDTGMILLGFATLMFGMETMSGAVAGLKDVPAFTNLFVAFQNPLLGVLAGALLTAIIQSSSASVGILQALAVTGSVSYAAAIPIIMGQNIGTTVTAMLSSIGTNKNARRAAVVHLLFNVIGVVVLLTVFCIVRAAFAPALLDESATMAGIAVTHSVFNVLCTAMLLPAGGLLEKLACRIVPDDPQTQGEKTTELDERLLPTPSLALRQSRAVAREMADCAVRALNNALTALDHNTPELAQSIRDDEERCDHYEDILGTYLVKLRKWAATRARRRPSYSRPSATLSAFLTTRSTFSPPLRRWSKRASRSPAAPSTSSPFSPPPSARSSPSRSRPLSSATSPSPPRSSRLSRSSTRSKSRCARATSCACSRAIAALRLALSSPIF